MWRVMSQHTHQPDQGPEPWKPGTNCHLCQYPAGAEKKHQSGGPLSPLTISASLLLGVPGSG